MANNIGKIEQIVSAVVDVTFENNKLPKIGNALECKIEDRILVMEVMQHIGDNAVRCLSMESTDGVYKGIDVIDTGNPITVPVGDSVLGRVVDICGRPVDDAGPVESEISWSIYRDSPDFSQQAIDGQILITGIKVIDFLTPMLKVVK